MSGSLPLWPRLVAVALATALIMAALVGLLTAWLVPSGTVSADSVLRVADARQEPPTPVEPAPLRTRDEESVARGSAEMPPSRTGTGKSEPSAVPPRVVERIDPQPAKLRVVEPLPGRYKAGDAFMQEVVVTRVSVYRILGADLGQNVQYAFVSRLTIDKVADDGGLIVRQKVQEARFGDGDPAMQELLKDALKNTKDGTFEMTLDAAGKVTQFKGAREPIKVFGNNNPLAGRTFLLWSFLDEDAWRELAQVTFFRPEGPLRPGDKWTRSFRHSWGPLGGWTGQTTYLPAGKQAGRERITYGHDLVYQPPRNGGELPFQVKKAEFKPLAASGAILFDSAKAKVAAAEETFRVRGAVLVSLGDIEAPIEMDEMQLFRLRITEAAAADR
jgi:hypothetical protein